ncbi:MAG: DUF3574 domain-containing protein [Tagaea sp.]|nr:DUF3574 domain-containing protein [Tagaea sp.]
MRAFVLLAALALSSCAGAPCPPGLTPGAALDLYFGRGIDGNPRAVSDAAWRGFVEEVLIREFPDGSTGVDAEGTWFSRRQGRTIVERSKVVTLIVPDARAADDRVGRLIAEYKRRFDQDSVLRVERAVCFAF